MKYFGFDLDNKPLKLHVTLGRIKKRLPEYFIQNVLSNNFSVQNFKISYVSLYQSILKPEGPQYSGIERFALKNNS